MLYLAFIFHMHQPYYANLLTKEMSLPWVRLHGIKDYLDMVQILEKFPRIQQTFNLVPSLVEQIEDYTSRSARDKFLELSYKPAQDLTKDERAFILGNFFSINVDRVISRHPRYYDLYLRKQAAREFSAQDYLDLQVWFNLAWTDPYFREAFPELKSLAAKARFFSEEEKKCALDKQFQILEGIVPAYRKFAESGQVELIISPFYHPILPLLYNTKIGKEANARTILPKINFSFPQDADSQIASAVKFYRERFGQGLSGMWPSEESVSEHILPFFIKNGINWIVTDEAILFKTLKKKKRATALLYQPHVLRREEGDLNVVFRDRNLSDLLGFVYYNMKPEDAVNDFMRHLENINRAFNDKDILVTVAMDGENAWEYYLNDGHDFLELLYGRLSESKTVKTTTVKRYIDSHKPQSGLKRLAAGSWIYGDFNKWIGNPYKVRAWEYLALARKELEDMLEAGKQVPELAWKQIYIAEGSDWFWWYGDDHQSFDPLFRMHLSNFYALIGKEAPAYLKAPLALG